MPCPFPGMDPFLEHPSYFPMLHGSLNFLILESLQAALPEPYFAVFNERLWVEASERFIEPDVDVLRRNAASRFPKSANGNVALITRSRPVVVRVPHDEHHEGFVEIRTKKRDRERVVTSIEVLSLSNKTPGDKGRELYLAKQNEVLHGEINLVEIDLLRGGEHTTAVPLSRLKRKVGAFDYHVVAHSFDKVTEYFVYPIQIEESLPEIAVPLLPGDGSVPLDLQKMFDRSYQAGPYKRRVDYQLDSIVPPLSAKKTRWVKQRLKEAGLSKQRG